MAGIESAIASATNSIRNGIRELTTLERGVFPSGQRGPIGAGGPTMQFSMQVHLSGGAVAYGLMNAGLAMQVPAMSALASRAGDLQAAIRHHTPQGPPRDLPPEIARMRMPRQYLAPSTNMSMAVWDTEGVALIRELEKTSPGGIDRQLLQKAIGILKSRHKFFRPPIIHLGDEETGFGSLWSSISVDVVQKEGMVDLEAYSNNYYAGYVEEGFNHGLAPVMRRSRGGGKILPRSVYTNLPISRLGDYKFFEQTNDIAYRNASDSEQVLNMGFAWQARTGELGYGDPTETLVSFTKRPVRKPQPGVHMFAKGFTDFLMDAAPAWRKDVDRIFTEAWEGGRAWYDIDRQFRIRKGMGRRSGQYSTKRP